MCCVRGAFYIAATWALAQGISQLGPSIGLPDWATRWFLVAAVVGFPFWIAFAWFYEFTPEGLKRESEIDPEDLITHHTGRKLDFATIGVLAIAVVLLVTDRFVLHHGVNEEAAIGAPEDSIAVLPFVDMSSGKDQEYFSDGISEELLNLLAKIPQLQVTARTSSFSFKGKEVAIPEIARCTLPTCSKARCARQAIRCGSRAATGMMLLPLLCRGPLAPSAAFDLSATA
jgi:hypothetical protein